MFNTESQQQQHPFAVSQAEPDVRAEFIRKTYSHLAGAILMYIAFTGILLSIPGIHNLAATMTTGFGWIVVLGLFIVASNVAESWAHSDASKAGKQYLGLGLYVCVFGLVSVPLLLLASSLGQVVGENLIQKAGIITLLLFGGLTATVFMTRKDFSFLGSIITVGSFVAFGIIIAGMIFGFSLGIFFAGAMVLLMAGSILYTTSNILHHYHPSQHVAAALALFAAVGTMFWYVLRIVIMLAASRD